MLKSIKRTGQSRHKKLLKSEEKSMKKFLASFLVLMMFVALLPTAAFADGIRLFNGKIEIAEPLEHAAKAYEEATGKHVEVESLGGGVDLQATLKQYYQAGNMPEIFVFEGAPDLANWTGMVVDMADQPWAADTDAGFVDESGALVGFPYTTEAIGLAYNKSILEKAGVDPASITGPESMKAAFEAIDAKKDELGITAVIGYCANATELYWSTGQHLFGQYLDAGLARDDTTYFDMLMEGKLDHDRFLAFSEMVDLFNKYADPALLVSGPSHWAVYKDGNVAEAEEFLNWLAGPDGQQIMVQEAGCVSPFKSCTVVANDPFAGPVSEYAAAGKTSSWHWMGQPSNLAQDFTGAIFQDYAMGLETPESFTEAMEDIIAQNVK